MLSVVLSVAPAYMPGMHRHAHAVPARAGPIRADLQALSDAGLLDTISSAVAAAQLPGFEFAEPPPSPKFSHTFMNAVSFYLLLSGTCTFGPVIKMEIKARFEALPEKGEPMTLAARVPTSTFGWLQADMRLPLPPLEEFNAPHRIGARAGQPVFLCREDLALQFAEIERSVDFSHHYGEEVYICSHPLQKPSTAGVE